VFGSVSLFAAENEQMLKPHLPHIVNKSMELALSAKEPYNYFLLLRALFRSIGGGSHDLLYQEFLPLLPNLLQSLNSLQSGLHKQHMKDLFVELCLTVPVRLSSLLPYLPMLMVNKNWTSYFILFGRKIVFNFIYFCTQIFSRILLCLL
jgi:transformation/transcription domain-associated protein